MQKVFSLACFVLGSYRSIVLYCVPHRPSRLTQCCTRFKSLGLKFFVYCICIIMWHSHLNDMKIPEKKRFIPKGFELGTTLS